MNPITTQEEYYQAKHEFFALNAKQERTQDEIDRFYYLLNVISDYEASTGLVDENEYNPKP